MKEVSSREYMGVGSVTSEVHQLEQKIARAKRVIEVLYGLAKSQADFAKSIQPNWRGCQRGTSQAEQVLEKLGDSIVEWL